MGSSEAFDQDVVDFEESTKDDVEYEIDEGEYADTAVEQPEESDDAVEGEEDSSDTPTEQSDEEESADAVEADEPQDEATQLRKRNEMLAQQVEQLSQLLQGQGYTPAQAQQAAQQAVSATPEVSAPQQDAAPVSLLNGKTLEDIFQSNESFEEFLLDYGRQVISATHQATMAAIPQAVRHVVHQEQVNRMTAEKFYADNPDLAGNPQFVSLTMNQVVAENPSWSLAQQLEETAKRARAALGVRQKAAASPATRKTVRKGGTRGKGGGVVNATQKEIMDLIGG